MNFDLFLFFFDFKGLVLYILIEYGFLEKKIFVYNKELDVILIL